MPPVPHQREAMLREHRSFAVEDLVVDPELLENARDAGYATKVIFIATEDPNLNVGRTLIRMSRGGQSVPLSTIPESYEDSVKSLRGLDGTLMMRLCTTIRRTGRDTGWWPASYQGNRSE